MMHHNYGRPQPVLLIVDDNPVERFVHRQALEGAGFEIIEAKDGATAIAAFSENRPDMVLLDVVMPEMDGFEVCRAIRAMPAGSTVPILMATGLDDVDSIDKAYRVGATDFIGKPINWMVLVQRVRYTLRAADALTKLRVSEGRLAEAQRIAGLGHFHWITSGAAIECSAEVLRIFGISSDTGSLAVRSLLRRIPATDRHELFRAVRGAIAGASIDLDHRVIAGDGELRTVCLLGEVAVEPGAPTYIHGTYQDITERKRVESELKIARDAAQSASAAKTAFLAAMSHELRTPLNAIIGFSELIAGEQFGPVQEPKYIEFSRCIKNAGQQMFDLVVDVLTMAELEGGRYKLELASVDLCEAGRSALAEFRRSRAATGRNFIFETAEDRLLVEVDRQALEQMICKLLANAVKFSETGTSVDVMVGRNGDGSAWLSVTDHGIGMTAGEAARAVQPFHQIDGRIARKYEGAGLGLSIVSKLIESHGGRFTIVSAPQQGTTVSLIFPPIAKYRNRRDERVWGSRIAPPPC
jgi:two-component system, cell cycle sensor histidine kinase PleC